MRRRYAIAAASAAVLLALACQDATRPEAPAYFEGKVTQVFLVKDVFAGDGYSSANVSLKNSLTDLCQQAEVNATPSTFVATLASPGTNLGLAGLTSARVIRASPLPAEDSCPLEIAATRIDIVEQDH
jgi:hypothetical protein